jgi:hypothetical protein
MATTNPVSFLLNQSPAAQENAVVQAPAFSLTKVLASAAIIITPIATIIVDQLKSVKLTAGNYVALAIGVLGFLAIAAAADVLARSLATAAKENAEAAREAAAQSAQTTLAGLGQVVPFTKPLAGHRIAQGDDPSITVLASAHVGEPHFLVKEGESLTWVPTAKVRIP